MRDIKVLLSLYTHIHTIGICAGSPICTTCLPVTVSKACSSIGDLGLEPVSTIHWVVPFAPYPPYALPTAIIGNTLSFSSWYTLPTYNKCSTNTTTWLAASWEGAWKLSMCLAYTRRWSTSINMSCACMSLQSRVLRSCPLENTQYLCAELKLMESAEMQL